MGIISDVKLLKVFLGVWASVYIVLFSAEIKESMFLPIVQKCCKKLDPICSKSK